MDTRDHRALIKELTGIVLEGDPPYESEGFIAWTAMPSGLSGSEKNMLQERGESVDILDHMFWVRESVLNFTRYEAEDRNELIKFTLKKIHDRLSVYYLFINDL